MQLWRTNETKKGIQMKYDLVKNSFMQEFGIHISKRDFNEKGYKYCERFFRLCVKTMADN